MKSSLKKRLCLSLFITLFIFISACGTSEQKGSPAATPAPGDPGVADRDSTITTEPGTFPIVKDTVTLKVLVVDTGRVENIQTNAFTQWYEELTNVRVEWEIVPSEQANEKLNLMLASGDYPDVIMKFKMSPSQLMVYGDQGIFLPLNQLIAEHGTYSKQLFEQKPLLQRAVTSTSGNIYALPHYGECYHCSMPMKMWINEKWLRALNLAMPETTEDFYNVLKAFKEKDPNGNGLRDEIPLAASNSSGDRLSIQNFLMNAFLYYDTESNHGLLIGENRRLTAAYAQDAYREGLKYLNRLYNEGLLAPETFTQDANQLRNMGENPGAEILGAFPALFMGSATQIGGESGRWLDYTALAPLEGPEGTRAAPFNPLYTFDFSGFIITKASKHPEVALRWGEGFYKEDIMMRVRYGVENEGWRWVEADKPSIDGGKARWERLKTYDAVQNSHWGQMNHDYLSLEHRHSEAAENPAENLEAILYNATKNKYEPYKQDAANVLPPLWFTEEQAGELLELETSITNYVKEMAARFILSDASLDKDWNAYIHTLKTIGLDQYLEIYQSAFDAANE